MPVLLAVIVFTIGFVLLIKKLFLLAFLSGLFVVGLLIQTRKAQVIEFENPYPKRHTDT